MINFDNTTYLAYSGLAAFFLLTITHYIITLIRFSQPRTNDKGDKIPPLVPYFLPLLGNIPWKFAISPIDFFSTSKWFARAGHPVRIKLFTWEFYIIQGSEHVLSHLSQTSTSNTIFNSTFLDKACGMSKAGVARWESPSEEIPNYRARKNYLDASPLFSWASADIHSFLSGKSALQISSRFEEYLRRRIRAHPAILAADGMLMDDFLEFFSGDVSSALVDCMCGTGLVDRNPNFPKAFWTFCDNLPTYMKGTPRVMARKAYQGRDDCVAAVKDWQLWASENFDVSTTPVDEHGDDKNWGSRFFRERYKLLVYEMGFSPADMASMELGFLFGDVHFFDVTHYDRITDWVDSASANATQNTYWCAIEVFKDKSLLADIRKEVQACKIAKQGDDLHFDVAHLLQQPLLSAVFAESLRLRTHNMFIRKTMADIKILDWFIPSNRFVIAWTTPGHMDPAVWTDANTRFSHPVDTFWPGRFLKAVDEVGAPKFSLKDREGSWIPFGSGANICPGRHFAKVHCILTVAMMVESFDCDILAEPKNLKLDLSKFGMGVLGPSGKVPARLRRRRA